MILSINDLAQIREKYKDKKIVFTGGVWDVFHTSHIRAFKDLHRYGDIIVVGVVSDKRVKERKGDKRPILSQDERVEIVDSIKHVDYTVLMGNPDKDKLARPTIEILESLRPDVFVSVDKEWIKYTDILDSLNVKLNIVKRIHPTSSTLIIEKIIEKYISNE